MAATEFLWRRLIIVLGVSCSWQRRKTLSLGKKTTNPKDLICNILSEFRSQATRKGYIALIDQSLISGVTFFTSVLLARFLRPTEYGAFVLAYAIFLFLNGVQEALVTNPLMVLNAPLEENKLRQYVTSTAIFQVLLGLSFIFLLLGTFAFSSHYFPKFAFVSVFPVLAFVVFAFQAQELFRRVLFARMNFSGGFINDLIAYGCQIIGISFLVYTKSLSIVNAFGVIAISFMIAAFFGCVQCRDFLTGRIFAFKSVMKGNWNQGRWLLGSNLALWISSQSGLFITAFFLGPVGPAVLKASQNIVAPTHIILQSLENLIPSPASRKLATKGRLAFQRFLNKATKVVLTLVIPYLLLVSLYPEWLLKLFYHDQYKRYGIIVVLIAVRYIFASSNMVNMIGLRVLRKSKDIFHAYLYAGILTIIVSIPLVKYFGIIGGAIGALLSSITVFLLNKHSFKKFLTEMTSDSRKHKVKE